MKSNQKSFTVIELLVVIAVIALLASIILVSLSKARERARIAAVMQFSNSLRASLSDALVSTWSLNEGTGTTVGDAWGRNTGTLGDGTCTPGTGSCPDWTEGIAGDALSFDGTNDCLRIEDDPSLNFDATESFTIEVWVNTSEIGGVQKIIAKHYAASGYHLSISNSSNNYAHFDVLGQTTTLSGTTRILPGTWHHLVGVRDIPNDLLRIYVDAVEENNKTDEATGGAGTIYPLYIGCFHGFDDFYGGIIDEVKIYNRALTASEIQKRYTEGLKKYQLVKE